MMEMLALFMLLLAGGLGLDLGLQCIGVHRARRSLILLASLSCAVVLIPQPAYAAFFSGAETFFKSNFAAADAAITVLFAGLRGIFLIYTGVSLLKVVNVARSGDSDWQEAAKTPAVIVVLVILGDVLTSIII